MTCSAPCLAGFLSLCSLLLFTVWVTSENQLAKLVLRGSSVLPQDFRGPQTGLSFGRVGPAQLLCISRLEGSSIETVSDLLSAKMPTAGIQSLEHELPNIVFLRL